MKRQGAALWICLLLLACIVGTAAEIVTTVHRSRGLFQELEALRREQDRLQGDWSALQLEVSSLTAHARIDTKARNELGMVDPGQQLRFVEVTR